LGKNSALKNMDYLTLPLNFTPINLLAQKLKTFKPGNIKSFAAVERKT
jgi:hypothetical protein